MKICKNCNHKLEDDSKFCIYCGTKFDDESESVAEDTVLKSNIETADVVNTVNLEQNDQTAQASVKGAEQNLYAQPQFGQQSNGYVQNSYDQPQFVQQPNAYGQSPYGQPQFGQQSNGFAQNPYVQPQFGQQSNGFAQNPYGQPQFAQQPNRFAQNPYGQPQFGQQPNGVTQNPYGQPPFGQYQPAYPVKNKKPIELTEEQVAKRTKNIEKVKVIIIVVCFVALIALILGSVSFDSIEYGLPVSALVITLVGFALAITAAVGVKKCYIPNKKLHIIWKILIIIIIFVLVASLIISSISVSQVENNILYDRIGKFDSILASKFRYVSSEPWVGIRNGHIFTLDSNPYDYESDYYESYRYADDVDNFIKQLHKELGVPESVFESMQYTCWNDGEQVYNHQDALKISWTYHPSRGLEVEYITGNYKFL